MFDGEDIYLSSSNSKQQPGDEVLLDTITGLFVLFFLGSLGWALLTPLRVPAPALLGTIVIVGTLRILGYPLPATPEFFSPAVQVFLGLFVGSKVTRDTVNQLKAMIPPALVIVVWALSLVFGMGYFISRITYLDPVTAILSSSVGGLPEMTVIGLDTNADIPAMITIKLVRMLATIFTFPFLVKLVAKNDRENNKNISINNMEEFENNRKVNTLDKIRGKIASFNVKSFLRSALLSLLSLAIAAAGGLLFINLGVPAGGMVGSMFFVAIANLLRAPVITPSPGVFGFMLVGVGLMVADNIAPETLEAFLTDGIIIPIIISTTLVFLSSFLVAYLIHKLAGWDFTTSFLAAAPGGFTIMTALAIKYNKDPFRVSILHLCRLLAIKSVVPFVFMLY